MKSSGLRLDAIKNRAPLRNVKLIDPDDKLVIPALKRCRLKVCGTVPRSLPLKTTVQVQPEEATTTTPETNAQQAFAEPEFVENERLKAYSLEPPLVAEDLADYESYEDDDSEEDTLESRYMDSDFVQRDVPVPDLLRSFGMPEVDRPRRAEIPPEVTVKVIPTPQKRHRVKQESQPTVEPEEPKPIKVIRKRKEQAPKVMEAISTSAPVAILDGLVCSGSD